MISVYLLLDWYVPYLGNEEDECRVTSEISVTIRNKLSFPFRFTVYLCPSKNSYVQFE